MHNRSTVVVLCAAVAAGLAAWTACSENEGSSPLKRTRREPRNPTSVQVPPTAEPEPVRKTERPPPRRTDRVKSRTETRRPRPPDGFGDWVAAPLIYVHRAVGMRSHASDKIKEAIATRTFNMFEAEKGRKPTSIKELNDWLVKGGSTALAEPDGGGVYAYDSKGKRVVIIDPPEEK